MGLYIKDIVLPEDPNEIIEFAVKGDGALYVIGEHYWPDAIEVPEPHGRLGDLDELYNHLNEWYLTHECGFLGNEKIYIKAMLSGIRDAPTVIPTSKEV